ncbi:hypothetical protein FHS27_003181 [Rhodopirellula rubra]|uniref:Uncharacterized protein n=1 Tax=Aporhodopirellula rubra TaxID=980271 RepID=A0A7W5DZF7_9BACT|nr:hypothetical protein [Aporhodopirellula rubra]MBB3207360.1 hypothetical protein [Aporhodopirellula rubra]
MKSEEFERSLLAGLPGHAGLTLPLGVGIFAYYVLGIETLRHDLLVPAATLGLRTGPPEQAGALGGGGWRLSLRTGALGEGWVFRHFVGSLERCGENVVTAT